MINPEPHNVYLAMIVDEAKHLSVDGKPAADLLHAVQGLTQEHFPDTNSRWLFSTIATLIQSGVLPRGGAVMASATREQKQYVEDALALIGPESSVETGSFSVARKALVEAAVQRDIFRRVEAAKSCLKEGRVMDADEALRAPSDLQGALLTPLRQDTYERDSLDEGAAKFIQSPWKEFNDALGGGYGVGGTFAVTAVIGQSGQGKALPIDTPIPTPLGWRTMGDLQVGDYVFDAYGQPTRITNATEVMRGHKLFRVTFDDGTSLDADADHLWESFTHVARSHQVNRKIVPLPPEIVTTQQMSESVMLYREKSSYRNHAIRVGGAVEFPEQKLLIDPYVLGVWLGDGDSRGGKITCHDDDLETIDHVVAAGYILRKQRSLSTKYCWCAWGLGAKLKSLNLIRNKHVPPEYLTGSREQRLALLQGLMDTDGTCNPSGGCTFDNKNEGLVDAVITLVKSLGGKATKAVRVAKLYGRPCGLSHRANFTVDFPVFRLKRKLERQRTSKNRQTQKRRYVVSVEEIPSRPVKCIAVEHEEHLYIAGKDYIVTHNSTWARQQVPFFAESGHRVLYCAGEADHDEVLRDIYTLTAGVTKAALRSRVPIAVDQYRAAYHYLQRFPKAIQVVTERRFTPEQILELAHVARAELEIDRREGRAGPDAQLLVIVDNLDHAIPKIQRMSEWEVVDETLGHFAGSASQNDFGLMLLAQPSSEGAGKFGPNRLYEIQGGKRASNHLATVLSLWRPTTDEHRRAELKDGSPHPYRLPCVAKLKCRAEGSLDDIPFDTNAAGLWYPRGSTPLRRKFLGGKVEIEKPGQLPW